MDQLNAQRMFCCRDANDARKAMITSSAALLLTTLMLLVGAALYAYYEPMRLAGSEPAIFNEDSNYIFPVWIVTELPVGLRGLILAGIFAAAISSLDSILAALSQTTISLFSKKDASPAKISKELVYSRLLVVFWGITLSAFAIELDSLRGKVNVVVLAFGMVSYTTGPMLGMFLAAIFTPKVQVKGLALGFALSFALVAYLRPDIYQILLNFDLITQTQALKWSGLKEVTGELKPTINTAWAWPVTVFLTWGTALCLPRKTK